jgi:hypothetical protein
MKRLIVLAATLLSACGPSSPAAKPTPTAVQHGPAIVQVENSPFARPHAGLQQADIVFEYLAEGGITRMSVIYFHPSGGFKIEPVRSARPVTLRIQQAYHGVIFYSGANQKVLDQIASQHIPSLTEGSDGGVYFRRDPSRQAPHNLYTTADWLAQGLAKYAPVIDYRLPPAGTPPVSSSSSPGAAQATRIMFSQTSFHRVTYVYSASDQTYAYSDQIGPLTDVDTGSGVRIKNVVLVQVSHHNAGFTDVLGAPAVDFDLQGTGPADVFTGGRHYSVTWDLSNPGEPLRLMLAGKVMPLPSGLTWIHLVDPGTAVTIT